MDISVVVPVHNSRATLPVLVPRILDALASLDGTVEILLVDDGSTDDSWSMIRGLAAGHPEVCGLRLARNVGEQNAVLCGVLHARLDVIATIDDDLQQPPCSLPVLASALTDDVDVVYGTAAQYEHGALRELAAIVTKSVLERGFGVPDASEATSFRVFRAHLRRSFPDWPGPLCSIDGLLSAATTKVLHVEVGHHPRVAGTSQYTPSKLFTHTMSTIVGGSTSPLLFATVAGIVCLVASTLGVVGMLVRRIVDGPISPAWLFAFVLVALLGLVLVALGILAEYAVRILLKAGSAPAFVVAESTWED